MYLLFLGRISASISWTKFVCCDKQSAQNFKFSSFPFCVTVFYKLRDSDFLCFLFRKVDLTMEEFNVSLDKGFLLTMVDFATECQKKVDDYSKIIVSAADALVKLLLR